jgi:hypothetical protein
MSIAIGSYYSFSREVVAEINKLANRVRNIDPTVAVDLFGRRYGTNRWSVAAIDHMAKAVATADGKSPSLIFGSHWHSGRDIFVALIALEARVTALGH